MRQCLLRKSGEIFEKYFQKNLIEDLTFYELEFW